MEYAEHNLVPISIIGIGYAGKKLFKKELVPVTGWKQILSTYITIIAGIVVGVNIKNQINKNTKPSPKPN